MSPVPRELEDGTVLIRTLPNGDQVVASKGWTHMNPDGPEAQRDKAIRKRAKKLMQGLLMTQKIADGRQREEAWLRCRAAATKLIDEEGHS